MIIEYIYKDLISYDNARLSIYKYIECINMNNSFPRKL